jgi:hypothetical protein
MLIFKSLGSTNKGVDKFIINTVSSKERSCDPFKSTSMLRKSAKYLCRVNIQNYLANEEWTDIKVVEVEVVFNIIPTGTPRTI